MLKFDKVDHHSLIGTRGDKIKTRLSGDPRPTQVAERRSFLWGATIPSYAGSIRDEKDPRE